MARAAPLARSAGRLLAGRIPLLCLTVALFAVYAGYALARQAGYLTAGYDLGIFDQAVRNYAHLRAPVVPLKGNGYDIFADHFHPIIAMAAPFYWIWNSPDVLLVGQAALIAASVPFVYAFAARRMSGRAALVVAAGYGCGWAIQAMVDFDFHEVAYGLPLLAAAIDALDRDDDRVLLIAAGLLLLVREDMGVLLVMLGLLRLLRRGRPPRTGWLLIGAGVLGYLVVTSWVIPAFAPNGRFAYWTFDALGPDLPHAVGNILTHPVHAVRLFFTPSVKAQTLAFLFVPLAFLPLRSRYCLIVLPLLAERFFNSRDMVWTTHYHYNALPWLVLVLAMVDGGQRLGVWSHRRLRAAMLAYLLAVPIALTVHDPVTPAVFHRMLTGEAFAVNQHLRDQRAAVAQVPAGICVSVDDRLAPQLTNRDRVTLPGIPTPRTDYLVLDLSQQQVGFQLAAPGVVLSQARAAGFVTVFSQGQLIVLRSPDYTGPSAGCRR
ncbi:MAG TPA: DUF2079 domain-containing protein [Jatrophihabitans sp.]|nr:DUF2079 domain-containing protein [Jatrophihabitans sp.]